MNAFLHSRRAIELAESAFFDPSMTAMLYFPDEHVYAVYLPLFLPAFVPVVLGMLKQLKRVITRKPE
jgi:phosphatidylinositol glycan class S